MGLKRFDFNLKDNKKKKSIIGVTIIVLVLLVGITIYATYAAYKDIKTYNIIQGKVKEFINADLSVAIKLIDASGNETVATDFPSYLEYAYLTDKSSCNNGSEITFNEGEWSATITSSEKDKCTLYFEQRSTKTLSEAILASSTLVETAPDFSTEATDTNTNIYQAEDDYGTSYYFRGATTNNYVKFGTYAEDTTLTVYDYNNLAEKTVEVKAGSPMYWRIIRINGDGSVRLIYDGTEKVANGTAHTATIQATAYNTNYDDAKYVGYTYDNNGTETDSTIKGVVDAWYDKHLETTYGTYIEDSIFCNDRTSRTAEDGYVYYAPYDRLETNKQPVLTCTNKEDRYTVEDTTNGNGLLTNPVGLLTADEAFMAGGTTSSNYSYYLYSGEMYWTSASNYFYGYSAAVWYVFIDGGVNDYYVYHGNSNARPVINLDANIKLYGTGTVSDPYRLTK